MDDTTREVVGLEVRELVRDSFLADAPIVATSAQSGLGMAELKAALADVCRRVTAKPAAEWFRLPSWRRAVAPPPGASQGPWLIFSDQNLGPRLARRLEGPVVQVTPGPRFEKIAADHYRVRPGSRDDYDGLIEELHTIGRMPEQIVHLWAVAPRPLNVLVSSPAQGLTVARLGEMGVRRISVGSALARVAWGAFMRAANGAPKNPSVS